MVNNYVIPLTCIVPYIISPCKCCHCNVMSSSFLRYVYRDGLLLTTGDAGGCIKTWDIRTGQCIMALANVV